MKGIQSGLFIVLLNLLMIANASAASDVVRGIKGRAAGDAIALQTDSDIMALCDFNKQIVVTQFNVLCIYNGNKKSGW